MITEIWVKGEKLDLYSDANIKHSFQVNGFAEVKDRQASFTNSFSIPKTPNNVYIFGGLGISSDGSRIPYEKPECKVKIDGFDLIVNGWLNVTDNNDYEYKIFIYSGIIDFFKAIENKKIGEDLDLSEIDHQKSLSSVVASFTNPNYKYLIADYYGKTHYGSNVINIDYLSPSVKVSYLWNKIHEKYNFPFEGAVFNTEKFKNLWLTYPKPPVTGELLQKIATINFGGTTARLVFNPVPIGENETYHYFVSVDSDITEGELINYGEELSPFPLPGKYKFAENGRYKITINGYLDVKSNNLFPAPKYTTLIKNCNGCPPIIGVQSGISKFNLVVDTEDKYYINHNMFQSFSAGDIINLGFFNILEQFQNEGNVTMTIEKEVSSTISFTTELKDFYIKDFVKEILVQLGLTQFTNNENSKLKYKTTDERLLTAEVVDWSDKFIERTNESYVYESYAQNNIFAYQYNDKESNHNNGTLEVPNLNLQDQKTVFTSKTYSPELEVSLFNVGSKQEITNSFKMYNREIKNNETDYKPLEKRFFFLREKEISGNVTIGSEILQVQQNVSSIPFGTFEGLSWKSILAENYRGFNMILNQSRMHQISLNLSPVDLFHLSFEKKYFFKQEQQNYILDKLNFDEDKATGEFVMVKTIFDNHIIITWDSGTTEERSGNALLQTVKLKDLLPPLTELNTTFEWEKDTGSGFVPLGDGVSPRDINIGSGVNLIRLKGILNDEVYYSNVLKYEKVGANGIIYIDNAQDLGRGVFKYKLHVEEAPFVGYGGIIANRSDFNVKQTRILMYNAFIPDLNIPNVALTNSKVNPVNIPIGVYNCEIHVTSVIDEFDDGNINGDVYYSTSPSIDDSITGVYFYRNYPEPPI